MRNALFNTCLLIICMVTAVPAKAEQINIGSDTYLSGKNAVLSEPSSRDAFVSGFNVDVNAQVEKDVHVAGFNVNLNAPVGSDAYAAAFSVHVAQPIGSDLTASAYSINLEQSAVVSGNVRLAAKAIILDSPIGGSLVAVANDLILDGVVSGDALLTVSTLKFGPNAKINGKLKYYAREPVIIPESVIAGDHVQFERLTVENTGTAVGSAANGALPHFWPTLGSIIASLALLIGFLVATGAILFTFAADWIEEQKNTALFSPVKTMTLGVLGLSLAVGLAPVSGLTLIGIPLIPIALFAAMVLWILGYVIGAYAIGSRVAFAFSTTSASIGSRVGILAVTLIVLGLLNFIPVIGWLLNLAVVFLGLGTMVLQSARYIAQDEPRASAGA